MFKGALNCIKANIPVLAVQMAVNRLQLVAGSGPGSLKMKVFIKEERKTHIEVAETLLGSAGLTCVNVT